MKKILFLIAIFVGLANWCGAQSSDGQMWDTVSTSTSIDTVYMYPGTGTHGALFAASKTFTGRGGLANYIVVDSLTGATAVQIKLQYSNRTTPTKWYDKATYTLNAPVGGWPYKVLTHDTEFPFVRWRYEMISLASNGTAGNSTQKTRLWDVWSWKQIY